MSHGIAGLIVRRVLYLLPIWLGISLLAYATISLAPGDPAQVILLRRTGEIPPPELVERLRRELGLDDPFPLRYGRWMAGVARGDLGTSFRTGRPVLHDLAAHFPATLELALAGFLVALVVALPLGVLAAMRPGSLLDSGSRLLAILGASLPNFWLGYVLILGLAVELRLFPVAGRGGMAQLVLPALTLGIGGAAALVRLTRSSLMDELRTDYVRTARAKGLPERSVVLRHALRNAFNPIVSLMGIRFGGLLAGAVVIETVFAWPGLGKYMVDAIFDRDYPAIQGFVLFTGTLFLFLNLLVDLIYLWLDPRVRLNG